MGYIKIGGAALNQTPFDWENNIQNIKDAINQAKEQHIKLLCLPELAVTGYGCEDMFLSQWMPSKALKLLFELQTLCQNITVAIGLPIVFKEKLYNCCALVCNENIEGFYAKKNLTNTGVHYESRWFTAWETGYKDTININGKEYPIGDLIFDIDNLKIGFDCFDSNHSENNLADKNIDIVLNPSASCFSFSKSKNRHEHLSYSSKNHSCTYVFSNLLGNEAGKVIYDGEVIIYKNGELIQRNNPFSFHNISLVSADIDFDQNISASLPLAYEDKSRELEFTEAVSLGLFDYLRKSRSSGFVLSLSGGADSSACAVLISEMVKKGIKELGIEAFVKKSGIRVSNPSSIKNHFELTELILTTAYQSTRNSGKETFISAQSLAKSIGATFYNWSVSQEINSYTETIEKILERKLTWKQDDIALQNIQARSRVPIIWMLANINNALLIATSNRSEGDVGYATMDGDTAGSIAPIAGVDKHFIRNWLIWAENNLHQPGVKFVNALIPTAELRPEEHSQSDEKDLMPYDLLVQIEVLAIRNRNSPIQTYEALKKTRAESTDVLKNHVILFYRLWSRNQWKRERLAPSFHLDDFNINPGSWCRFPILSGSFAQEIKDLENSPN